MTEISGEVYPNDPYAIFQLDENANAEVPLKAVVGDVKVTIGTVKISGQGPGLRVEGIVTDRDWLAANPMFGSGISIETEAFVDPETATARVRTKQAHYISLTEVVND